MKVGSDFYGLPTGSLSNAHIQIDFLKAGGLRIVRVRLEGQDDNQLAEFPELKWPTPYGDYLFRGGHRLWHAPEAFPRSYVPEPYELLVEERARGVYLRQPTEAATGISKCMEISLEADRSAVTVQHTLRNDGMWPVELSPWGVTQLPLGGLAILPQAVATADTQPYSPNRCLVFWPYTKSRDPRLRLYDDFILIRARPKLPPCKVGYFNPLGWVGYLRGSVFFCKRFCPEPERAHPDKGCNVEVYCNNLFTELETLAPLCRLEPGHAVTHTEKWEFHTGIDVSQDLRGVCSLVRMLEL
jgi:hypothetical protein